MKILHYGLGFYPYRTGGMTKYVMDIMKIQKDQGNSVSLLWPGQIKLMSKTLKIRKNGLLHGIESFEVINPLPVPLLNGIKHTDCYMQQVKDTVYLKFLTDNKFNVIHIHTLMGLHKEFLESARKLNIKTIYTTHDYFGLCPKVNLLHQGSNCINGMNSGNCSLCNCDALSLKKVYILQSPLYRVLKNSRLLTKLRNNYKNRKNSSYDNLVEEKHPITKEKEGIGCNQYTRLQEYYRECFKLMDQIHYNSQVSKDVFHKFQIDNKFRVISISHSQIKDNRKVREYHAKKPLQLLYLGTIAEYKGFYYMKNILDQLYSHIDKII